MTTLKATLTITWNGNPCLDAKASVVMAYSIASAMRDDFAGTAAKAAWAKFPSFDEVYKAAGDFRFSYADDTGAVDIVSRPLAGA